MMVPPKYVTVQGRVVSAAPEVMLALGMSLDLAEA